METKIVKTVKEWLPWALENEDQVTEYALLQKLANYCLMKIHGGKTEEANQVIKIVDLIYSGGGLHDKNAVENEFLEVLAKDESPASLKEHTKVFSGKLKEAYLKTILEN